MPFSVFSSTFTTVPGFALSAAVKHVSKPVLGLGNPSIARADPQPKMDIRVTAHTANFTAISLKAAAQNEPQKSFRAQSSLMR
jgi:hypothetical protein